MNTLPFPIATLVRRARNARSAKEGHDLAHHAWEASVRLSVALDPPEDASGLARPSLGHWVRAMRVEEGQIDAAPLLTLFAMFIEVGSRQQVVSQPISVRRLLDALPTYRNRVIGHGGSRPTSFYERAGKTLSDGLEAAWRANIFLPRGARLVYTEGVELDEVGTRCGRVVDLSGPVPIVEHAGRRQPLSDNILPRRVYVRLAGVLRCLHPWLLYVGEEDAERVFFFNGLDGAPEFVDFCSGKTLSDLSERFVSLEADLRAVLRRGETSARATDSPMVGSTKAMPREGWEVRPSSNAAAEGAAVADRPARGKGPSPFFHRAPINVAAHFFGRQREVAAVLSRTVEASRPQCVSVIGSRRIGKSSLLRQLSDVRGPHLAVGEQPTLLTYHSLEGSGSQPVERFFQTLTRRIERLVDKYGLYRLPVPPSGGLTPEEVFTEWMEALSDASVRVVLLLDEFDVVTMNPYFDVDVFGRLRSVANAGSLAYVTASIGELAELCHHEEIRQSPFFNIFSTVQLGLFSDTEADDLLRTESEAAGERLTPENLEFIREMAGTHPFHIQQAANALWEAEPHASRDAVRAAFVEDAAPHWRYALAHLTPGQREVLLAMALTGQPGTSDAGDVSTLLRRGVLARWRGELAPFSECFANWLKEHATETVALAAEARVDPSESIPSAQVDTVALLAPPGPGTVMDQRYKLVREIGRGGFGVVFQAEDLVLRRDVAIKFLRPDRARGSAGRRLRKQFLQEARVASRINHPNVVTIHDVREHGEDMYFVMEHFAGQSLRDLLDASGALAVPLALSLASQAAAGLAAAHALGVVHRDVKPENLLVDAQGHLKIVDFGLALFAEMRLSTDENIAMTPRYCAPEQILGDGVDFRADVFGLGCVVYETLTGAYAFDGSTVAAILHNILNGTPSQHTARSDRLGQQLTTLVSRCLERDPARRHSSCAELAREFDQLRGPAPGD